MRNAIDSAGSFEGPSRSAVRSQKALAANRTDSRLALPRDWFTLREARVDLERLYAPRFSREFTIGPAS